LGFFALYLGNNERETAMKNVLQILGSSAIFLLIATLGTQLIAGELARLCIALWPG
jgi:hypothetical protein